MCTVTSFYITYNCVYIPILIFNVLETDECDAFMRYHIKYIFNDLSIPWTDTLVHHIWEEASYIHCGYYGL